MFTTLRLILVTLLLVSFEATMIRGHRGSIKGATTQGEASNTNRLLVAKGGGKGAKQTCDQVEEQLGAATSHMVKNFPREAMVNYVCNEISLNMIIKPMYSSPLEFFAGYKERGCLVSIVSDLLPHLEDHGIDPFTMTHEQCAEEAGNEYDAVEADGGIITHDHNDERRRYLEKFTKIAVAVGGAALFAFGDLAVDAAT